MASQKTVSWYELPLFRGLTEQVLVFGVPRKVIAFNVLTAILFIMDFHFFWIIPICIAMHFGAIYICQGGDPFFDCLASYMRKKNYYST